ncbi:uncharacterized protein LOC143637244 [Bidens hawaiensis]|uniref:uncharacterized protein LOC143637244 n=1 Tax=Bidens hawaiensis TaxID=980011 RepID=UPI00404A7A96
MDSLSNLLSKEGFTNSNSNKKKVKFNKTVTDHDLIALPIYICHNRRKSFDLPKHRRSSLSSVASSKARRLDEPAIDEVATKAVISILSGYAGRYLKDKECRDSLRDKCCLFSDNVVFGNMELGIESVEKLIENHPGTIKDMKVKLLRNSIGFLTIVALLNSKESRNPNTNTSNSQLSACAHLYLSIVYKIDKNDRICATHVLQVFVDSPQLARTHLLPDLWDHFFLPHLLHLKIWYNKQTQSLLKDQEQQVEHLRKVYEDHLNTGTVQFALYYKEWLKTGGQPPANLPFVPLPLVNLLPSSSTRRRSSSSFNNFLHRAIFGNDVEKQPSMEFDYEDITHKEEQEEEELCLDDYNTNQQINIESRLADRPSQSFKRQTNVTNLHVNSSSSSSDLTQAISTISSSQSLTECEMAIRVMAKAWLDDPLIEKTLSKPLIIQGMLEVLFSSNNEEVLELAISLLTEFVTRNESNCKIITNFDPQLEGFMNLMRNSSLFLKAASLLHLVKPEGKQMVSTEWIPLVLRVLEFGDQTQTLYSVRCSPQVAAYYFIDQLLNGVDQDRNMENGRQVISLGGLSLLLRRMTSGDIVEKMKGVSVIYRCVLSDGRCRHYLADNLNLELVLEVMVHAKELDCIETTIYLLIELICLHRFEQRTKLFDNLLRGWDCLNTMQILLVCLQRATRETRPLVAAIMFQLDLMGDPLESSAYREEAIEAIIESLDCEICNENVQQQAAKSLLILGSRYSYTGTPEAEKWILKEAGYDMSLEAVGLHGRYYVVQGSKTSVIKNQDSKFFTIYSRSGFDVFRSNHEHW